MSDCWIWNKLKTQAGYGRIYYEGKDRYAHRLIKTIIDKLPLEILDNPNIVFRHKCDTPACVNPDHIELGSQLENIEDMIKRKRNAVGSKCHTAKLTEEEVKEIKTLLRDSNVKKQDIAKKFRIAPSTISAIVSGYTWKHVKLN